MREINPQEPMEHLSIESRRTLVSGNGPCSGQDNLIMDTDVFTGH
jgi:hypothetical protein